MCMCVFACVRVCVFCLWCPILAGFGSVGYRRGFFQRSVPVPTAQGNVSISFHDYVRTALQDESCWRTDDLVLSSFLGLAGVRGVHACVCAFVSVYGCAFVSV